MAISINHPEELETWLRSRPPAVSAQLAARIALMAVPASGGRFRADLIGQTEQNGLLQTLRAVSLAWSRSFGYELSAVAPAVDVAYNRAVQASRDSPRAGSYSAFAALEAAYYLSNFFGGYLYVVAATNGARAANSKIGGDAVWRAIYEDIAIIEGVKGGPDEISQALGRTPLPLVAEGEWRRLRAELLQADPNWSVWIEWYEDRLAGKPQNRAFERALLSITDDEWKLPPGEVNALLSERSMAGQRPAVSVFDVVNGRIEGRSFSVGLAPEAAYAAGAHDELRRQLDKLAKRLKGFDDHPVAADILDDVVRILTHLGEQVEVADSARLLQQLEMLGAAEMRIEAARFDDQGRLPADIAPHIRQVAEQLKKFLGLFDEKLRRVNDRAEALNLRLSGVEDARKHLAAGVEIVKQAPNLVADSGIISLQAGFIESEKLTVQIESEKEEERRIQLEGLRAIEVAREIRNFENFTQIVIVEATREVATKKAKAGMIERAVGAIGDGVVEGLKDGTKKAVSGAVTASFALLGAKLLGPLVGLAMFVGSTFSKTVQNAKEAFADDESFDEETNDKAE